jgi:predicted nucleotide-binding protein/phosphoserine phosphatase
MKSLRIALFLDIDDALTMEPVLCTYARKLGCYKEYLRLNKIYKRTNLGRAQFNQKFVPLFKKHGFNKERAIEFYQDVKMHGGAEQLLGWKGGDVFLVTNGPDFYAYRLAEVYGIPSSRVYCTPYTFDRHGLIDRYRDPEKSKKGSFVDHMIQRGGYDITIGLGDNPDNDSEFLGHCSVRILHVPEAAGSEVKWSEEQHADYLRCYDLSTVTGLVEKVTGHSHRQTSVVRVFVAGAGRQATLAEQFGAALDRRRSKNGRPIEAQVWTRAFKLGEALKEVVTIIDRCDLAVVLLTPDTAVVSDPKRKGSATNNFVSRESVLIELGIAASAHGWSRTLMIRCVEGNNRVRDIPDVDGLIYQSLDVNSDGTADDAALAKVVDHVINAIQ